MPRHARLSIPGIPLHIRQRGVNRNPCFDSEADYQLYVGLMAELSPRFACSVHAHVLMTNFARSPVDSERYLLTCYRYVELNPVRAGIVRSPADYPWSSFRTNAMGVPSRFLDPHPEYLRLGATASDRQAAYLGMLTAGLSPSDLAAIRGSINANAALGDEGFIAGIEARLGRAARPVPRGRPAAAISSDRKKSLSPV